MKLFLSLLGIAVFAASAQAYVSMSGNDPNLGYYDVETKVVVKSEDATYSDAISKGMALYYQDTSLTGLYKVSRYYSGTQNTALASKHFACIAAKDVATGDVGGFPCVTKGYVDYAYYASVASPGAPIAVGDYLCVSTAATSKGYLVPCGSGVTSPFIALEAKTATGTGTMKISVQGR